MLREARLRPAEPRTVGGKEAPRGRQSTCRRTTTRRPCRPVGSADDHRDNVDRGGGLPADVLIDWDEVCRVSVEPALLTVPGSEAVP